MKDLTALVLVIACVTGARLHAQTAAATPKSVAAAPKAVAAAHGEKAKETTSPEREQIACQLVVWPERHGLEHQRTDDDRNLLRRSVF